MSGKISHFFPNHILRIVNKSAQAVRQKYVSSSFIFTMCLNSYYILEEVFLNITDEIFSNFLFILSVRSRSEYEQAADNWRADWSETERERGRELDLIFFILI